MSSTRSKDRELIATTSSLVEFLRDVALARRRGSWTSTSTKRVLWLDNLPAEVSVDIDAGPGEPLFAVPRLRAGGAAGATGRTDRLARQATRCADSSQPSPVLKEKGSAWVVVEAARRQQGHGRRSW